MPTRLPAHHRGQLTGSRRPSRAGASRSSAPAGSASRSPPPPARPGARSPCSRRPTLPLLRVLGPDGRRRSSPTCTASTASTCGSAPRCRPTDLRRRRPRRGRRRRRARARRWPRAGGLAVDDGVLVDAGAAHLGARRVRRRGHREPRTTRCWAGGSGSSTGTPRSTRARSPRTTSPGGDEAYDAAALLLHRPVRPGHGVRRPRPAADDEVVVHGDLGGRAFRAFWLARRAGSSRRCTPTTGTPPTTCAPRWPPDDLPEAPTAP